jgi:hypothetical protein
MMNDRVPRMMNAVCGGPGAQWLMTRDADFIARRARIVCHAH